VPTVTDLRARRLELTRATLRERLLAGDFDDVRAVVESLAQEFDVVDVAAAAIKMAHAGSAGDGGEERDFEVPVSSIERAAERGRTGHRRARETARDGNTVQLFVGAGRRAGIRPADLVGAIAGEAGVPSRTLGAIEIGESFSLVEVPDELAEGIIAAMRKASLRGQKVTVRRDREHK
jgi:ATP-dependent RNA helicase DeaD